MPGALCTADVGGVAYTVIKSSSECATTARASSICTHIQTYMSRKEPRRATDRDGDHYSIHVEKRINGSCHVVDLQSHHRHDIA